jgi:hypothetical protein
MTTRKKRKAHVRRSASLYEYTHRLHLAGLERRTPNLVVWGNIKERMEKQPAKGSS